MMIYWIAIVAIVVLVAILVAISYAEKARLAQVRADYQSKRAADAEASSRQHERTAAEILGVQRRHETEQKASDEKLENGDRDHLSGHW